MLLTNAFLSWLLSQCIELCWNLICSYSEFPYLPLPLSFMLSVLKQPLLSLQSLSVTFSSSFAFHLRIEMFSNFSHLKPRTSGKPNVHSNTYVTYPSNTVLCIAVAGWPWLLFHSSKGQGEKDRGITNRLLSWASLLYQDAQRL